MDNVELLMLDKTHLQLAKRRSSAKIDTNIIYQPIKYYPQKNFVTKTFTNTYLTNGFNENFKKLLVKLFIRS